MSSKLSNRHLSFGMQDPDDARLHRALDELGLYISETEKNHRIFGPTTQADLKALQAELGLPVTGVLDPETARAINQLLEALPGQPRRVRGKVRDANGRLVNALNGPLSVLVYSQGTGGEKNTGKADLDAANGTYEITYQPPAGSQRPVDIRIEVRDNRGPVKTIPNGESILTDAGLLEVVNFIISSEVRQPRSEFELLMHDLKPLLAGRSLAELNEREAGLLAIQSGYSPDAVAHLVVSFRLVGEANNGTPLPLFYGLIRQRLPADLDRL